MRILILLKKWPGGVGGGVKNINRELEKEGHYVETFSREEDLKIKSFFPSILKMRKFVKGKEKKFDIIYTQDWSLAFPLIFPFPLVRKKHFCMFHGNQFGKTIVLQNIIGKIMGKRLLCMAPSIKRRFPKANINYCGVNLEKFQVKKGKRAFLGWIKKATEMVNQKDVEEIAKKLRLPLLVGEGFTHEEMNDKFYSKCKVFISLPPPSAGFQASWLEAMAAGVPIVVGNKNGAGEIQPFDKIPDGEEKNIEEIIKIIKSPKGKNYREWIRKNDFTWRRHALELIRIFKNN
jgi:glycosyltransferase involved in cell wall biosynthesis